MDLTSLPSVPKCLEINPCSLELMVPHSRTLFQLPSVRSNFCVLPLHDVFNPSVWLGVDPVWRMTAFLKSAAN